MPTLEGQEVAFLIANEGVEQVELTDPWSILEKSGARAVLIAPEAGKVQAFDHLQKADAFDVDVTVDDADVGDYAALVLPGGVANPDRLRMDPDAVVFVKSLLEAGKPVTVICQGPWTLVEADFRAGSHHYQLPQRQDRHRERRR